MRPTILLLTLTLMSAWVNADEASINDMLQQAEALHTQAQAGDNGWVATVKLIEQARQAIDAGDSASANQLAERALRTASASVAQMQLEQEVWMTRAPGSAQ